MHAHSSLLSTAIAGEGSGEARWMAAAMNKAGGKKAITLNRATASALRMDQGKRNYTA